MHRLLAKPTSSHYQVIKYQGLVSAPPSETKAWRQRFTSAISCDCGVCVSEQLNNQIKYLSIYLSVCDALGFQLIAMLNSMLTLFRELLQRVEPRGGG